MTKPLPASQLRRKRPVTSSLYKPPRAKPESEVVPIASEMPVAQAISEAQAQVMRTQGPAIRGADRQAFESKLRKTEAVLKAEPTVSIRLPVRGPDNDVADIFVGINGVNFKLQRGIPIDVPLSVAELLRTAEYI